MLEYYKNCKARDIEVPPFDSSFENQKEVKLQSAK